MKIEARVPIYSGSNAQFAEGSAEKMIGQTTSDGWEVVAAEMESHQTIWLTIQKDDDSEDISALLKSDSYVLSLGTEGD